MANSGGGVILIGLRNSGKHSGVNVADIIQYDPANVTNKVASYINQQFSDFEILSLRRGGGLVAAVVIGAADTPMVFVRPGTYPVPGNRQETAFARGTVYFRHGAKSEPGTTDDLRRFVEARVEQLRKRWLAGVRKVVNAPVGSEVFVARPAAGMVSSVIRGRVVSDPGAPGFIPENADEVWPYRQIDVIRKVNARLKGKAHINSHDILCVRRAHNIDKNRRFMYRPYKKSIPQYSREFIDWLVAQYNKDAEFFQKARAIHRSSG